MHSILDSEAGTSAGLKSIDQTIRRLMTNFQLANVLTSHIRRTPMIDPKTGEIDERYYRDEMVNLFSMSEEDRFSYFVGMIEYIQHQGEDPTLTSDDDQGEEPPPEPKSHPTSHRQDQMQYLWIHLQLVMFPASRNLPQGQSLNNEQPT